MSEPTPISEFVQEGQRLIDAIVASQDSNEREMLRQQLLALLTQPNTEPK